MACRLFLFILFMCRLMVAHGEDQPLVARSFVKEDRVLLRWAPTTPALMIRGLTNGYRVERIDGTGAFENNASLTTFTIPPFLENKPAFGQSADQKIRDMAAFVEALLTPSLPSEAQQLSFAMLLLGASTDKELAMMLGLYLEDTLQLSKSVSYRVSIAGSGEASTPLVTDTRSASKNPRMTVLTGSARPRLKEVYLSWEAQSLREGYSAYWIERSTDQVHFEKRNPVPYIFFRSQYEPDKTHCDFVDSAVTEGMTYYYRITGINHFAETGESSSVVKVYVPRSLYGECHIDSITADHLARTVSGHFVNTRSHNELSRFVLFRSDSVREGYRLMAEQPNEDGSFRFVTTVPNESGDRYYYKVAALSPDNDTVFSFPYYFFTLDQEPPASPQGLSGHINDSGIVFLTWRVNPESDIRGYRIFRSNRLEEEFTEVTRFYLTDSVFTDTLALNNLTPEVYYRMTAVDLNFNNSPFSETLLLLKPDTIAPVPALFSGYAVHPGATEISWNNSSSEDLSTNLLLRYHQGRADTLLQWQDTTRHLADTSCIAGQTYVYRILSTDHAGNAQASQSLQVHYETGIRVGVKGIRSEVDRAEKLIRLYWTLPGEEIYSVQVYRAKNDGPFRLVATLRGEDTAQFTDRDLAINNTYSYRVKVVHRNGVSSVLSEPVIVVY